MRFRTAIYTAAAALTMGAVALPAAAQASVIQPLKPTEIVLKDGRGLDAQTQLRWQYNGIKHRWERVEVLTGKVIVDRNDPAFTMKYDLRLHRWVKVEGDQNQTEHFTLVYGPLGQKAFIRYDGPGAMHGWYVQTSDKKAPGVPAGVPWGYQGSKLVKFGFEATLFDVSLPGPLGYCTLTVPARIGLGGHGPEILTGEMFGQLGLNARTPLLPTNAQLFQAR